MQQVEDPREGGGGSGKTPAPTTKSSKSKLYLLGGALFLVLLIYAISRL